MDATLQIKCATPHAAGHRKKTAVPFKVGREVIQKSRAPLKGGTLPRRLRAPQKQGSWSAPTFDDIGRILHNLGRTAASQHNSNVAAQGPQSSK